VLPSFCNEVLPTGEMYGQNVEIDEDTEICRLCEAAVPKGTFETHSIFCLIGQQAAIQISTLDENLSDLVDELDTAIYAAAHNYLRRFLQDKEGIWGDHTIILSDDEFPIVREITVKVHQILKLHELNHKGLSTLELYISELDMLISHNRSKLQDAVMSSLEKIQENAKSKFLHFKSNYSACIALLDSTDDSYAASYEKEEAEYFQVAQKSFNARYSEAKPSLEDFEFLKPISKGAFGQVFLAKHKRTSDLFAIKVLKKNNIMRRKSMKRVNDEHKILQCANNPFIVKLFYSFQSDENLFLVMEYLPGGDLLSLLENIGYFDVEIARFYLAEIVLALEYLHKHGIIHRDLKPDNCIITKEGHVKLTDFGLSAIGLSQALHSEGLIEENGSPTSEKKLSEMSRRERAYSCVGTPDYLAPEILRGNGYDKACDFWSLGAMTYEFLAGLPPFTDETPDGVFKKIMDPDFVPEWPDDIEIPESAKDMVMNMLIRDPNQRLGSRKGIEEIKNHPFFEGIQWNSLLSSQPQFKPHEGVNYFVEACAEKHKSVDVDIHKLNLKRLNLDLNESPHTGGSNSGKSSSPGSSFVSPRAQHSPRTKSVTAFPSFQFRNLNSLAEQNDTIISNLPKNN
jgi:serine/threonine protein kinase